MTSGPTRERHPRRRLTVGAMWVTASAVALALGGPFALRPFVDAAGAASDVAVAFVVDFGGTSGQVSGCVTVPASDNGYAALAAFASQEHLAVPTYASSGLLCSIGGIPATGCGQATPGGYVYWSYFRGGTGRWAYASSGAFASVTPGDVEGWRFQDPGTGNPNDPPPRVAPDYGQLCAATVSTTTTPTTAPAPTVVNPPTAVPPSGATPQSVTPATGAAPVPATGTSPPVTAPAAAVVPTTTPAAGPPRTPGGRPATAPVGVRSAVGVVHPSGSPGGSGLAPLLAGVLLAVALAVAAAARWRRRPRV